LGDSWGVVVLCSWIAGSELERRGDMLGWSPMTDMRWSASPFSEMDMSLTSDTWIAAGACRGASAAAPEVASLVPVLSRFSPLGLPDCGPSPPSEPLEWLISRSASTAERELIPCGTPSGGAAGVEAAWGGGMQGARAARGGAAPTSSADHVVPGGRLRHVCSMPSRASAAGVVPAACGGRPAGASAGRAAACAASAEEVATHDEDCRRLATSRESAMLACSCAARMAVLTGMPAVPGAAWPGGAVGACCLISICSCICICICDCRAPEVAAETSAVACGAD